MYKPKFSSTYRKPARPVPPKKEEDNKELSFEVEESREMYIDEALAHFNLTIDDIDLSSIRFWVASSYDDNLNHGEISFKVKHWINPDYENEYKDYLNKMEIYKEEIKLWNAVRAAVPENKMFLTMNDKEEYLNSLK